MIGRQGSGSRETFIVRKQSFGVGVERIFPVHSPKIEKLEVVARGDVRRAKLYYLRGRVGKRARVAERRWGIEDDLVIATEEEAVPLDSEGVAQEEAEDVPPAEAEGEQEPAAEEPARRSRRRRRTRQSLPRGRGRRGRSGARGRSGVRGRGGRRLRGTELIPRPTTRKGAFLELIVIVAMAIGLALMIQAFVVKPYQIPSASMEPTLDIGQRVLVNRVNYHFSDPDRGDIVVFHPPDGRRERQALRREARRTSGDTDADENTYNPATQACPDADGGHVRHELHQAGRRRPRRPPANRGRAPRGQRRGARRRTSSAPAAAETAATCRKRS